MHSFKRFFSEETEDPEISVAGRVYANGDEVEEEMTPSQRIKAKQRMKRMSKRIQIAKKRAMKRPPTPEKIALRARRQAKNTFVKKWAKGKQKGEMSFAQRAQIEKRLKTAGPRIDRLAKRMIPAVRLQDKERRAMSKEKAANKDAK